MLPFRYKYVPAVEISGAWSFVFRFLPLRNKTLLMLHDESDAHTTVNMRTGTSVLVEVLRFLPLPCSGSCL